MKKVLFSTAMVLVLAIFAMPAWALDASEIHREQGPDGPYLVAPDNNPVYYYENRLVLFEFGYADIYDKDGNVVTTLQIVVDDVIGKRIVDLSTGMVVLCLPDWSLVFADKNGEFHVPDPRSGKVLTLKYEEGPDGPQLFGPGGMIVEVAPNSMIRFANVFEMAADGPEASKSVVVGNGEAGPMNPGDPEPHLAGNGEAGPMNPGDPEPHLGGAVVSHPIQGGVEFTNQ